MGQVFANRTKKIRKKNLNKNVNKKSEIFLGAEFTSSQIWCYLIFGGDDGSGGGGMGIWGQKIKVAQNSLKHILVLEFLKSDEIFEIS